MGEWEVKGEELESNGRGWSDKIKYTTAGIYWETPLNIHLDINNERQDCKIGTVCGGGQVLVGGGMKKTKVRGYGW
jgi:hypothetical protein